MAGRFSVEAFFKASDRFSRPVAKMEKGLERFTRSARVGLRSVDRSMGRVAQGLRRAGLAAGAAGAAMAVVGKTLVDGGADFEQAIVDVGAAGLKTRAEIGDLEAKALSLGATTKFTATEAANAMEILAKAGFSNREILAGVGGVLDAAAASGLGMAEVADHVTKALNGMGLEANQAGKVADVLTVASARTNSTIGSLGESLRNVSTTAKQFNIPLEQVVASVALLQDVGLDASVAGSAMNTMLTKLAAPTAGLRAEMKRLGVSFEDADGNMLALPEVLGNIARAAEKSGGNMKQVAFLAELVGLRGQKAAQNLADLAKSGKLDSLVFELEASAGKAKEMADLRMKSLRGEFTLLGSAVDATKIALFNLQGGALRGVVKATREWVDANRSVVVQGVQDFAQQVADNLPKIVLWLKRIGKGLAAFFALAVAVKVANLALATFDLVMGAAGVTTRIVGSAFKLTRLAVLGLTSATVVNTVKTAASTVARVAWNAAIAIGRLGTLQLTTATIAGTVATAANTVATWAQRPAHLARNLVVKGGAAAMGALRTVTLATTTATTAGATAMKTAAVTMGPFVATVGAAAAAVGSLALAWSQWKKFNAETEGLGVVGMLAKMGEMGTLDPFAAVDAHHNELARKRAAEGRQVLGTAERVQRSVSESTSTTKAEVTIRDESGRASVTRAPAGPGVSLAMPPSGAF